MPHILSYLGALMAVCAAVSSSLASGLDVVLFKSGMELRGTVVKVDANLVTIKRGDLYQTFAKGLVRRIDDTATTGAYFAASEQSLPPWRALANDLRSNEGIGRLEFVEQGRENFAGVSDVPSTRFRVNGEADLVLFGDPGKPAGLLIGLRGGKAGRDAERKRMRSLLAGFLTAPNEVSALYDIELGGGSRDAGRLSFVFSTERRDGMRWWLAAWNPERLRQLPGQPSMESGGLDAYAFGFYRDRNGRIRAIERRPH